MPKFHYNLYFIFLLISIIYGCQEKDKSIYFPLSEEMQWQYDRSIQYTRRAIDSKLIIESIGSEKVNDKTIFIKQNHAGEKTYFYQTDTKILRNAKEPYFEDISIDEEAHFVMPVQLTPGDQWRLLSRPYIIEHAIEYEVALQTSTPAIKLSKPLYLDFELESITETVDVAAGRYTNCAKIVGHGSCQMSASGGNFSGSIDVHVKHTDWFCPGIGLTKTVRSEIDPSSLIEPVTYQLELKKLKKK